MHEEFINLPNCLAQLIVPALDNLKIHMDLISINDDKYESSSDDMEFDNASLLTPIVDVTCMSRSGQRLCTPSDSPITYCISSNLTFNALSDAEDVDSTQYMDIDAPHTRNPGMLCECKTDPIIDDPTMSSSTIIADPAKPEPHSKIDQLMLIPI
jgi:hypothetical protein